MQNPVKPIKEIRINLTQERLKELLRYDPDTGDFTRLVRTSNRIKVGDVAGSIDKNAGYLQISVCGVLYRAHRLAWFYMKGVWPEADTDHENTIRSDNRWKNLREGSRSFNMQNLRKAHRDNKTGFQGVTSDGKDGFQAKVGLNYKTYYLGTYPTPELAHAEYLAAKRELHPGCTI